MLENDGVMDIGLIDQIERSRGLKKPIMGERMPSEAQDCAADVLDRTIPELDFHKGVGILCSSFSLPLLVLKLRAFPNAIQFICTSF